MPRTTAREWQPSRRGFSRSLGLRRGLWDRLLRQKCEQTPHDDAAVEPPLPHVHIFLCRPSKATTYRLSDTEFFTNDPNGVRYVLLRVENRRVLWALSARVLHERCPAWLREYEWKRSYSRHDCLPRVCEPAVRSLRAVMNLLHGNLGGGVGDLLPASGPFDSPFVNCLVYYRDLFDLAPLVDPLIHNILEHLGHAGGQYIMSLKDWPLLVPVCSRFQNQKLFDMLSRRYIRKCEVGWTNLPMCQGTSLCGLKTAEWYQEFLSRRQAVVNEVLAFLQDTATDFTSRPKGQSKQRCARVITQQLKQVHQCKTRDGRFTTTSLENIVEGLRKDDGDGDSPPAAPSRETLEQVALAATKIVDCRVSQMLFLMK